MDAACRRRVKKSCKTSVHYFSTINWSLNDIIYNILWSLSLARPALKVKKIVTFVVFGLLIFFNRRSTCDFPASIYDRKMDARTFDTTNNVLWCLSFVQSLFKDENTPIWRIGNRRVKRWDTGTKIDFWWKCWSARRFCDWSGLGQSGPSSPTEVHSPQTWTGPTRTSKCAGSPSPPPYPSHARCAWSEFNL